MLHYRHVEYPLKKRIALMPCSNILQGIFIFKYTLKKAHTRRHPSTG